MRALIALAPFAVLAACATSGSMTGGDARDNIDATVQMTSNLRFAPSAITVQSGDTVLFQNISTSATSVTTVADTPAERQVARAPAGASIDSGSIAPGESFTYVFTTPGSYTYFSEPQFGNGMVGTVIVNP